jgi:hypothetical protein
MLLRHVSANVVGAERLITPANAGKGGPINVPVRG